MSLHAIANIENVILHRYDEHPLDIHEAPEPSNILYVNHGYSLLNVCGRRFLTSILSSIIIVVSFGLIASAQFAARDAKMDTSFCVEDTVYDPSPSNATSQAVTCYCLSVGVQSAMKV